MRGVSCWILSALVCVAAANDFTVSLKSKGVLGLQLVPPSGSGDGLAVSDVRDGAVHQTGLVRPGDTLLAVNGRSLAGVGFREAVSMLQGAAWPLALKFRAGDGRQVGAHAAAAATAQEAERVEAAAATAESPSGRAARRADGWAALHLSKPSILAGSYPVRLAEFSAPLSSCVPVQFQLAGLACTAAAAAAAAAEGPDVERVVGAESGEDESAVAVAVVDRGRCPFARKALSAHGAGAESMLLVETTSEPADRLRRLPRGPYHTEALETGGFLSAVFTRQHGELLKQVLRAKEPVSGVFHPEGHACAAELVAAAETAPPPPQDDNRRGKREPTPVTYQTAAWAPGRGESFSAVRALFGGVDLPRAALAVLAAGHACGDEPLPPTARDRVVVARRGVCAFEVKAKVAQAAGAAAILIVNSADTPLRVGAQDGDDIFIPVTVCGRTPGEAVMEMAQTDEGREAGAVIRFVRGTGW